MKIKLLKGSKEVGHIEWVMKNRTFKTGELKSVVHQDEDIQKTILSRIQNNGKQRDPIMVRQDMPDDLSKYLDGILILLDSLSKEIPGLGYKYDGPDLSIVLPGRQVL